ncbi:hypothetical protein Q1695_015614 [Nippostrongylus brasiliensis]|nr:hypothetical protein Q1695_015614 [Nippostrongylus brasiliensis]
MDRKDIEDFLRRSNSICDQTAPELSAVNVRRMSLKEFTGLDQTKSEVSDLHVPTWKCSTSPSSLINSFSARRRSVLASDLPPSPSKKLTTAKEESIDLPTAIDRVSSLQQRLQGEDSSAKMTSSSSSSASTVDNCHLLEESKRVAAAAKELASISFSSPEAKWSTAVAEITDCADCLTTAALDSKTATNVYHSQLVTTEVTQILDALHSALCDAQESRRQKNDQLSLKSMTRLQSATNQLLYAVSTIVTTSTT